MLDLEQSLLLGDEILLAELVHEPLRTPRHLGLLLVLGGSGGLGTVIERMEERTNLIQAEELVRRSGCELRRLQNVLGL